MTFRLTAIVTILAASLSAQSAQSSETPSAERFIYSGRTIRFVLSRPGFWKSVPSLGDAKAKANLERLAALLRETPSGTNPTGWYAQLSATAPTAEVIPPGFTRQTAPLRHSLGFFPMGIAEDLKKDKSGNEVWKMDLSGETHPVSYTINRLPSAAGFEVIADAEDSKRMYSVAPTGPTFRGFPVMQGGIVVAAPGRSIWTAAPMSAVLSASITRYTKDAENAQRTRGDAVKRYAEISKPAYEERERANFESAWGTMKLTQPDAYTARLNRMRKDLQADIARERLNANPPRTNSKETDWYWEPVDALDQATRTLGRLTAAEAAAPACFIAFARKDGHNDAKGRVVPAGTAGCLPVWEINPQYFDKSKPRTAPQILIVEDAEKCLKLLNGRYVIPEEKKNIWMNGCPVHNRIFAELDWGKLQEFVK